MGKFWYLKGEPSNDKALKLLRERMAIQIRKPEDDPLSKKLVDCVERFKDDLKGRILDVGCYTGILYHQLKEPAGYTGIDKWPEAIKVAKEYFPKADFRIADGMEFQGRYDVLWCSQIVWSKTKIAATTAIKAMEHLAKTRIFIITDGDASGIPGAYKLGGGLSAVVFRD